MVAIKAPFDGRALIPEEPVSLPRGQILIVHIESDAGSAAQQSPLEPVIVPADGNQARRIIEDQEVAMENL